MSFNPYPESVRQQVRDMHRDHPEMTFGNIASATGLHYNTVRYYINGCRIKNHKKPAHKHCHACKTDVPLNSKFCFMCGEKIPLTPAEEAVEGLKSILRNATMLPEAIRDSAVNAINYSIKAIGIGGK